MSFTNEQRKLYFTHIAFLDATSGQRDAWPYTTWLAWAQLLTPNPFSALLGKSASAIREVQLPILATSPALALTIDGAEYLSGELSMRPIELSSDALIVPLKGRPLRPFMVPPGERLDVKGITLRGSATQLSLTDAATIASDLWELPNSARAIAQVATKHLKAFVVPSRRTVSRTTKRPVLYTVSQRRLLADLGIEGAEHTDATALDGALRSIFGRALAEAFIVDNPDITARELAVYRIQVEQKRLVEARLASTIAAFVKLGLMRRIALDMGFLVQPTRDLAGLLLQLARVKSASDAATELVTQRYETLVKVSEAMHYNGCPHTKLGIRSLCSAPAFFPEHLRPFLGGAPPTPAASNAVRDDDLDAMKAALMAPIICQVCGLDLVCPHAFVRHVSAASAIVPLSDFVRTQGRYTICKLCGEIVYDDIMADISIVAAQDPDCRRVLYGRYMLCKAFAGGPPPKLVDFVYDAVYLQFGSIDALRGTTADQREALQRVYCDIYLLVACGLLGYKLRLRESRGNDGGAGAGAHTALDTLIAIVQKLNGRTLEALSIDHLRLTAVVTAAVKALKHRLMRVEDAVEVDPAVGAINSLVLIQFVLVGSINSSVAMLAGSSSAPLTRQKLDELKTDGLCRLIIEAAPRMDLWLRSFAAWWVKAAGVESSIVATPVAELQALESAVNARYPNQRFGRMLLRSVAPVGSIAGMFDGAHQPPVTWHYRRGVVPLSGVMPADTVVRWKALIEAGVAPHFTFSNAESVAIFKQHIKRNDHRLFIEAFVQTCPVTIEAARAGKGVPNVHDWQSGSVNAPPKCTLCGATLKDIYESDAYFERYEKLFTAVTFSAVGSVAHGALDAPLAEPSYAPGPEAFPSPDELTVSTQRLADKLGIDARYLFSLGDLMGRTYDQTRTEAYEPRYSNWRFSCLCSYYQRTFNMLAYNENIDSGPMFKLDKIAEFHKAGHPSTTSKTHGGATDDGASRTLLDRIGANMVEFMAISARLEMPKNAICSLIVRWCDDIFAGLAGGDRKLVELIARDVLAADKKSATFDKRDLVGILSSATDDAAMTDDAGMQRSDFTHDAFYEDFLFEGDGDQIAIHD